VAENYLRQYANKEDVDKTFGLYHKHGELFIGDSPVKIEGDDIIVKDKEYQGNNNNIRLICQDKPLDHNTSYLYIHICLAGKVDV